MAQDKKDEFVPLDPQRQLGYQLVRVADRVSRLWNAALRAHATNPRQFSVLALLAHDPNLNQAELARRVMISPQSMSELLHKLSVTGLITRDPVASGFATRVRITPAGRKLLAKAYPIVTACNRDSFAVLTRVEREQLARLLAKLLAAAPPDDST